MNMELKLPTFQLSVAGRVHDFIIDSASTYSIFSEDLAIKWSQLENVNYELEPFCKEIRTVNGSVVRPIGTINISLSINANEVPVRGLVLRNPPFPIFLGIDFLRQYSVDINIGQNFVYSPFFGCMPMLTKANCPGLTNFNHDKYICDNDPLKDRGDLTDSQKADLRKLLNKYKTVFSNKPGSTTAYYHRINTGDAKPVTCRPHKIPHYKKALVEKEIKKLLHDGIIVPSTSEWSSPCLLVNANDEKKNP